MDSRILGFTCVIIAAVLFGSIYSLAKLPLADIDPILLSAIVYPIAPYSIVMASKSLKRMV